MLGCGKGESGFPVKDFSVFDFNYVPKQPVMRDECKTLINEMVQFEISGIPNHQAVVGGRGSGRTVMVKFLEHVIPEHTTLDVVYANCRHHNTSFKVLAHLSGVPPRGSSMPEVFKCFCRQHRKKTVVVLDEIDLMSRKDRRRASP